ncbi:arylesterase [Brucella cytisi]|jgi:acyl-CoA thioesterase-1|uniref:Arylesterase n=1 Tax=Brucella cytisi TaxID=407152 RepID=A0A1J6HZT8_9HYPH|nr:arylesterase [Brucella cytisi]MCR5940191.1 arylesterase [Ochrobactrum sp. XJ1]NKC50016.1 arylesterase [Brucella cytisi]OIS92138.1 arylesterase [Brucella cytisi]
MRFKLSIPAWLPIFAMMASFMAASPIIAASAQEDPTGLEDALPTEQLSQVKIVGFGDSLMAGYLLPANAAFPQQLEKALNDKGVEVSIENAGVSGDTTTGGLSRIDWSVPDGTDLVILELGANDALRGIEPDITEKNLDEMLARLKQRGISVILAGMMAPPNMGKDYAAKFNPIYPKLAQKYGVPLYPFFLDGVATKKDFLLEDGMHPNEKGVETMVSNFMPTIEKSLTDMQNKGTSGG